MTEKMREAFEAWYFDGAIDRAKERTPHGYKYIAAQASWLGWCAATRAERERCALLCDAYNTIDNPVRPSDCATAIRQGGAG